MDKDEILKWLEQKGTRRNIEGMARYGIHSDRAFGVSIGTMRPLAKRLGGRRISALHLLIRERSAWRLQFSIRARHRWESSKCLLGHADERLPKQMRADLASTFIRPGLIDGLRAGLKRRNSTSKRQRELSKCKRSKREFSTMFPHKPEDWPRVFRAKSQRR
jgi:hypothetical protein